MTTGSASWAFLGLLGLVGGGPTFLGTLVGTVFRSEPVLIGFLALAAGAIIYVVNELLGVARTFKSKLASPEVIMWGVLLGFFAGYGTDLVITWSGI
jgi:ZIP family zinc transporter